MTQGLLTRRALNRALLARQMLLERRRASPAAAVEHLVALQAQQARPPFVGLWSRVEGFRREELRDRIERREVVRATFLRGTLHLLSARDYLAFRPVLQPMLTGAAAAILGDRFRSLDLDAVLAEARRLFAAGPLTFTKVRTELLARFPDADERAMGYTVRMHLPLILPPTEREWSFPADPTFTLAEEWLGRPLEDPGTPHALVLRYLAAFGPASAADAQAWSGLRGLAPVLNDLRPRLAVFRDERKRQLFDLPDAPRPPEETPAPARFVADFDNLTLSHADRTRVIADEHRGAVSTKNGIILPTILVDGFVAGTWKVSRSGKRATLAVSPFDALPAAARDELAAEGEDLARFVEPDAERYEVRFHG